MLTFHNKQYSLQVQVINLTDSGVPARRTVNEGGFVTFPIQFKNIPSVVVVPPLGSTGVWWISGCTTTGCVIQLAGPPSAGEVLPVDIDFEIVIAAFERP